MNQERKRIQTEQADWALAESQSWMVRQPQRRSLIIARSDLHLGVVGLIASRLSQHWLRPVGVLTELEDEHAKADFSNNSSAIWKGSLRAPAGYHLARQLQKIQEQDPSLF